MAKTQAKKTIKRSTTKAASNKKVVSKTRGAKTHKRVPSVKKTSVKKPVASKKRATSVRKAVPKKVVPKKTAAKRTTPKKPATKKVVVKASRKKAAPSKPKKVVRPKPSKKTTVSRRKVAKKSARKSSASRRAKTVRASRPRRSTRSFIKIRVVGVGGGGGNAISRMRNSFSVRGVEFIAVNTDIQDLEVCDAHKKLHIGKALTKGMGAGMNPDLGQQAAEENRSEIAEAIQGSDMIFLTAGFGGGTGTGAAPVIADIAREMGILTVAVVTKPFGFEGTERMKIAEDGLMRIKDRVDTLLVIPNDRIFGIIDKNTSVGRAFEKIDEVLQSSVQGVAEVIASSGLVNVDFADIKTIMAGSGMAVVGVGAATGSDRAVKAVNQAIHSPLLDVSIDGAKSVMFGIAGGRDMRMSEINDAAKIITDIVDQGARIIFGAYYDRRLKAGTVKITLIATGFNGMAMRSGADSLTLFNDRVDTPSLMDDPLGESLDDVSSESLGTQDVTSGEEPETSDEEIWDIPTFLRKKGKRN